MVVSGQEANKCGRLSQNKLDDRASNNSLNRDKTSYVVLETALSRWQRFQVLYVALEQFEQEQW